MAAMPAAPAARQDVGICEGDSAQGQDWDLVCAGLVKRVEACRVPRLFFRRRGRRRRRSRRSRRLGLLLLGSDRRLRSGELLVRVGGQECPPHIAVPDCSYFLRGEVVGAEVDAVGLDG